MDIILESRCDANSWTCVGSNLILNLLPLYCQSLRAFCLLPLSPLHFLSYDLGRTILLAPCLSNNLLSPSFPIVLFHRQLYAEDISKSLFRVEYTLTGTGSIGGSW